MFHAEVGLFLNQLVLVLRIDNKATRETIMIPANFNLKRMNAMMQAEVKAINAANNQPPIKLSTPATLAPALSLPQAISAKLVPMATIKLTNVVLSGTFLNVA